IYVRPFPNVEGGKKQISSGGGIRPAWSRDGRHLYYLTGMFPPIALNGVERRGTGALDFGPVEFVLDAGSYVGATMLGRSYDVAADGRFLMPRSAWEAGAGGLLGVSLIPNWAAPLPPVRGRSPAARKSARTRSLRSWAPGAWARSIARAIRRSIATSQSRSCPSCSPPIPIDWRGSRARRRRWRR